MKQKFTRTVTLGQPAISVDTRRVCVNSTKRKVLVNATHPYSTYLGPCFSLVWLFSLLPSAHLPLQCTLLLLLLLLLLLMLQEGGYLELQKQENFSHCKEECETIAKVQSATMCGWLSPPRACDARTRARRRSSLPLLQY